jgi:hypothetical protein
MATIPERPAPNLITRVTSLAFERLGRSPACFLDGYRALVTPVTLLIVSPNSMNEHVLKIPKAVTRYFMGEQRRDKKSTCVRPL